MHDLVIENARVINGLGGRAMEGGVAIKGGRIAAVGKNLGSAQTRVDADGQVVAPGIESLSRVGPPQGSDSLIQEQEKEPTFSLGDMFSGQKSTL